MTSLPTFAHRRTATVGFFSLALLFAAGGCKPTLPGSTASRQPSADDAKVYVQTLLPSALRLSNFQADAPMRQPNTSPDGNTWTVSVKATLTPAEDLLAAASLEQDHAFYAATDDLDDLKAWRNTYVRSRYARTYGAFDLPTLPPPAHLLVVQQPKGKPLAPIYGKVAAEWQVDHWRWSNVDLEPPSSLGQPRALFTDDPTLVLGSPEADAVRVAQQGLDEFRHKQATTEDRFAKDLAAATKPGTVYRGQVKHPNGVLPCEVRFVEAKGAGDPQTVTFEVRLPQDPAYLYVYRAKLGSKIPLNIALGAAYQPVSSTTSDADTDVPVGDLSVRYVRGTGKLAAFGNLPGMMLNAAMGGSYSDVPFVLLGGHLKGVVGDFNGEFALSADLVR